VFAHNVTLHGNLSRVPAAQKNSYYSFFNSDFENPIPTVGIELDPLARGPPQYPNLKERTHIPTAGDSFDLHTTLKTHSRNVGCNDAQLGSLARVLGPSALQRSNRVLLKYFWTSNMEINLWKRFPGDRLFRIKTSSPSGQS